MLEEVTCGVRKVTREMLDAAELAGRYNGLPEDTSRGQVLAAFKHAAPYMNISNRLVCFIDTLFSFSQEHDWMGFNRPLVWPSNDKLCEVMGLGERQVQRLIKTALNLGLMVEKTGPNGKRSGYRHNGIIMRAFGFDLSPLAVRFEEFQKTAKDGAAFRKELKALRQAGGARVREIRQLVAYYHDERHGLLPAARSDAFMQMVFDHQKQCDGLYEKLDKVYRVLDKGKLEELVAALQENYNDLYYRLQEVVPSFDGEAGDVDNINTSVDNLNIESCTGDFNVTHNTTTTQPKSAKADTSSGYCGKGIAQERDKLSQEEGRKDIVSDPDGASQGEMSPIKVSITDVVRISPRLSQFIGCSTPDWPRLKKLAAVLKDPLGISDHAWRDAELTLGDERLVACIAVIDAKRDHLRSPGGYLRGMTEAYRSGELNIEGSVYGLKSCH